MEFLQRHLPRVYQAVQSALDYITNVTAQIFGAPPNAPQPGNARAKTPLRPEEEMAPAGQEEAKVQGADHMTLSLDASLDDAALEATEESMKIYGIQQGVENQAQETVVRHRKENVDRSLHDLHDTINDGKDTFSPHQITIKKHEDQNQSKVTTHDQKPEKPEDIDDIPCTVVREVLHAEVHTVVNEEVQTLDQETLVYEEYTGIKTDENSSPFSLEDLMRDIEPKRYREQEIPSTSNQVLKDNLNLEMKENSCSSSNVNVSPSPEKIIIIHQEISEGGLICHVEADQGSPEDVLTAPVMMEYDDLDVPDIKTQHKKLVTPVSAADSSPCDQGEEGRKTWEHLQETAVRLAQHCDLLQDDDQEIDMLESYETPKSIQVDEMHSSRPIEQGNSGELLEKTSHDSKEVKEPSEDEEQSEEVSSLSRPEEENHHDEQDQKVEKMKRRVHFSPSTEERDQMIGLTLDDFIQEGALEPITEYRGLPPYSLSRPQPNSEENNLGSIGSYHDNKTSMTDTTTEEDQVNPLDTIHTIWYDDLEMNTDEDTCNSRADVTYTSVSLGFQPQDTIVVNPDEKSPKELSTDVPSVEEMKKDKEEPTKNSMSTSDNIPNFIVDSEVECHHEEGTQSFNKVDNSSGFVSDHSRQEGSNSGDYEVTSISLEAICQLIDETKVELLVNEGKESLTQHVHGDGNIEYADSKKEQHELWHHPSAEEIKDSSEGALTSMTAELYLHESVSRLQGELHELHENMVVEYTVDEGYNQTSVQVCDMSKYEQSQDNIIRIDSSTADQVQKGEDPGEHNEPSVGRNPLMMTEIQKEEDVIGKECEDIGEMRQISEQIEEHVSGKNGHKIQGIEDDMLDQSEGLGTFSDSNKELGSQKDQNPTQEMEELSEQLDYEDSDNEVMSKDEEKGQTNQRVSGSNENPTTVTDLNIIPETEPRQTSVSTYPEDGLGSDDKLAVICRHPEKGFDLLSKVQSVINTNQSEQNSSEPMEGSEVTHGAVLSGEMEVEFTEGNFTVEQSFKTDNVVTDIDLQCMLTQGYPVDKISEDQAEENQTSVRREEASRDQSLHMVKELEVPFDNGTLAQEHKEVVLDQTLEVDDISESQDGGDLLPEIHSMMEMDHPAEVLEIMSTMNVSNPDLGIEDVGHANEEHSEGILSEEIIVEEHENLEELISEGLGSLIESKQTFKEEHYSSIGIAVTENKKEVSDVEMDIDYTSVEILENNKEEEVSREEVDQSFVTLDDTLSEQLGDHSVNNANERQVTLENESFDPTEVVLDQTLEVDDISEPQNGGELLREIHSMMEMDHPADVLEIRSTTNVSNSDLGMEDVGHANEDHSSGILSEEIIVEEHENLEELISEGLESPIESKQTFKEEQYSSIEITVPENKQEVSDVEIDFDHTSVEILENNDGKEVSREEVDQSFVTLDDTLSGQLGDQPLNNGNEHQVALENESVDLTEVVLDQTLVTPGYPVDKISEDPAEENQTSDRPDEASRDESLDMVKELEVPFDNGSLAQEHKEVVLDQTMEVDDISEAQDGGEFLTEVPSMMSMDHPAEELEIMSTMNVGQSDKGMEDVSQCNEETFAGILSEKIAIEVHENLEKHTSSHQFTEELGSLIEAKQTLEEEHYPFIETTVTETVIECGIGLDSDNTSIQILENKEEDYKAVEDIASTSLYEKSSEHLGDQPLDNVKELEIPIDTESSAEVNREEMVSVPDLYSGTLEKGGDLLSNTPPSVITSVMNVDVPDNGMEDSGQPNDEANVDILSETVIVAHQEDPDSSYSEELGSNLMLEHTSEKQHYSTIVVPMTQGEAADISVLTKETDSSLETHNNFIPDQTSEKISENKEKEYQISQSSETLDDASRRQFEDLKGNDHVIPLETGSLVDDIHVILRSSSELSEDKGDLLAEMVDHPPKVITVASDEEDLLDTSNICDILDESAVCADIPSETGISDEHEKIQNNVPVISQADELGFRQESSKELEENQLISSFPVSTEESHIGLDIVNTTEESMKVLVEDNEHKEMDLLSEIQSLMTSDYSITTILSTVNVVVSDEASEKDSLPKSITMNDKEGSEETTHELHPKQPSKELEKNLLEQASSSPTLTFSEDITGFDINESSKTSEIQLLEHTSQEEIEVEGKEKLSNDEVLHLGQTKHVITIHTEEPSKVIEPPTRIELSGDSFSHHKETLMEPSMEEEEDDVDNNLLPHNTLDVSAQKSRVQLRRKTSIRRKQGQRQATPESEPIERPQPVIRPRPMGVAIFPGNMPIFSIPPTMTPEVSYPEEERKEEKPVQEDLLVKPKKGIPKHGGFGIPHPKMMQELQARLKKKKPNE
ncbi:apolipoprotein B receptor [Leptodactylus fuscus]|uniref:apolipoprotein B receptor n=1 Tax=Leptodactylus fuscus TaxID=238119 RepID=UPI003F4F33B2